MVIFMIIWHSVWICFKGAPVHKMMGFIVSFMKLYTCSHFEIKTLHAMNISIDRVRVDIIHPFPQKSVSLFCWLTKEGYSESRLYAVNVHWSRTTTIGFEANRGCSQILVDFMLKGPDFIIYFSLHIEASGCSKKIPF